MSYSLDIVTETSLSDDEIFFGQLTLKEVKKRLFWNKFSKPHAASAVNSPRKNEHYDSVEILKTHSEPNLLPSKQEHDQNSYEPITSEWDMREDDSFIKLENMVEKLCVSSTSANCIKTEELNNTLEVIEYILNNPPSGANKQTVETVTDSKIKTETYVEKVNDEVLNEICLKKLQQISPQKTVKANKIVPMESPEPPQNTPIKPQKKYLQETAGFMTPIDTKPNPIFKTPAQPLSLKKPASSSKKTPSSKSNAYQHISSPVASYIKNVPVVPLLKVVNPKKPLPGPSSIPKFKNNLPVKSCNKENINLPSVAYKSAKKTKVIEMPDEHKLPQSQWAKKIMTSLPRPVVMKHEHREQNCFAKRKLLPQQEDSFVDLSYHQAEVSVCTQKTAFKTN